MMEVSSAPAVLKCADRLVQHPFSWKGFESQRMGMGAKSRIAEMIGNCIVLNAFGFSEAIIRDSIAAPNGHEKEHIERETRFVL